MEANTFLEEFGHLAELPGGIAKLRELVLQLAVRGKLLEQDERDEPSSILLTKLNARELKTSLYLLPASWKWTTLGEVSDLAMGNSPPGTSYNDTGEGVPLVNGPVEFSPGPFGLTIKSKFTTQPTKMCRSGDLLLCVRGSTTGRTNIAAFDACIGRGVASVRAKIDQRYLNYLVLSMRQAILESGTGSTFPSISQRQIEAYPVPLPPLAEQKRIVAKVDELLKLCDELEQRQERQAELRTTIARSAWASVTQVATPTDCSTAWNLIAHNFDCLTSVPTTIPDLRQAILQLAVMGKLVKQDERDEPVSSSGDISNDSEPPYLLPENWRWLRWDSVLSSDGGAFKRGPFGSSLTKSMFVESGYKVYEQYCPINDDCSFARYFISPEKFDEMRAFAVQAGDFLISCSGVTLGRITQVPLKFEPGIINQAILRVRINAAMFDSYFYKQLFRSPYFQNQIFANSTGSAIPNVKGVRDLKAILLPVPPLAEQKRIVAKVNQLLGLCDALETQLNHSQTTGQQLLASLVAEVLGGANAPSPATSTA